MLQIAIIAVVALGCGESGPTETRPSALVGTWVVDTEMTEIWSLQEAGVFSKVNALENECIQRNGSWRADDNHIWTTFNDKTIKQMYKLEGMMLSVAEHGKKTVRMEKSEKEPFELMMLAGHCMSEG